MTASKDASRLSESEIVKERVPSNEVSEGAARRKTQTFGVRDPFGITAGAFRRATFTHLRYRASRYLSACASHSERVLASRRFLRKHTGPRFPR